MSRYLKDLRGKFAGSIGEGRDETPYPALVPPSPALRVVADTVPLAEVTGLLTLPSRPSTCFVADCTVTPRDRQQTTCAKHQAPAFARHCLQLDQAAVDWLLSDPIPGDLELDYLTKYLVEHQEWFTPEQMHQVLSRPEWTSRRVNAVPGQVRTRVVFSRWAPRFYLPDDLLIQLAGSPSFTVKEFLIRRHRAMPLPQAAVRVLAADPNAQLRLHLVHAGELPADVVDAFKNDANAQVAAVAHRTNPVWTGRRGADFRTLVTLREPPADVLTQCRTYIGTHASTREVREAALTLLADGWDGDIVSLLAAAERLAG